MFPECVKRRLRLELRRAAFILIPSLVTFCVSQSSDVPKGALGQISGHVYRADSGEPIPKAQVQLFGTDDDTTKAAGQRIARTGADGAFLFADLPAGNYQIDAWRNGYSDWNPADRDDTPSDDRVRTLSLRAGQRIEDVAVHLYPAGVISGQVVDEDQEPVPGLQVFALRITWVEGGQRKIQLARQAVTDDLGNYRMADLPPGAYYVRAGGLMNRTMEQVGLKESPAGGVQYQNTFFPGTGSLSEAQPVNVGPLAETRDVHLTVPPIRTFKLRGRVLSGVGLDRKRVQEIQCKRPEDAGYNFGSGNDSANVEADGSFEFSGLPPGEYTLAAVAVDRGIRSELGFASARIADGDVRANVQLGDAAGIRGTIEAPRGISLSGRRIILQTFGPGFYLLHPSSELGAGGQFEIKDVPPGDFTFSISGADKSVYVKKAICNGRDYAAREFKLSVDSRLDCAVTLGADMGAIQGKVTAHDDPAPRVVVVAFPASSELRKVSRYTMSCKTDSAGRFKIADVIPAGYVLFAVPPTADRSYFDPAFADLVNGAEKVTIDASASETVNLKLSEVKR
jgi:uncharacterized protein (DUF2141 family)